MSTQLPQTIIKLALLITLPFGTILFFMGDSLYISTLAFGLGLAYCSIAAALGLGIYRIGWIDVTKDAELLQTLVTAIAVTVPMIVCLYDLLYG